MLFSGTIQRWLQFVLLATIFSQQSLLADTLPEGLFLIALTERGWQFVRVNNGEPEFIDAIEHPRGGAYHPKLNRIAYIGSDNTFSEVDLATADISVLSQGNTETSRYTQLRYTQDGSQLLAVELPEGRSRRTIIIGIDTATKTRYHYVRKRTAQFEPYMRSPEMLFYTTAICVDDCEGMIWELWRRNMQTAKQEQLTLMNAVARQPHLGFDGWLYFSSNAGSGHYNIWRMKPEVGSPPEQLTSGSERDSSPSTDQQGNLYFLRKDRSKTRLMRWREGMEAELVLPSTIQDLRFLEIVQ